MNTAETWSGKQVSSPFNCRVTADIRTVLLTATGKGCGLMEEHSGNCCKNSKGLGMTI